MPVTSSTRLAVGEAFARRDAAGRRLAEDAERIARACRDMAARFHQGGKLVVFGNGGAGTDASHVAVEFMHPVVVGKRALPALALGNDSATVTGVTAREGFAEVFAHQIRHWADPADIALGISPDGACANVLRGLETARELGLYTMALLGGDGGAVARSPAVDQALIARSCDPAVVKEIHVTTYHVLWELVHVFFAQTVPPGSAGSETGEPETSARAAGRARRASEGGGDRDVEAVR
ncbi:phosphoheptose isomerase [Sphaerisporangium siamense]|uniref:D-sedoheptulose 7-phosphate isomerase n=1 Tax=Sphaerisporangium siamense TaxID=795645 RepID=A0A7W7DA72_9ACTN|nr:SIS domain-containing protein [Sphaerisporangium siamense]MBB4701658.1 D-sedoheptulose 7-phosphate isomerase [Sphaerisporangium siamense]GII84438.1 phosphoheptose isomerase [Sphaerisporangium siamense]